MPLQQKFFSQEFSEYLEEALQKIPPDQRGDIVNKIHVVARRGLIVLVLRHLKSKDKEKCDKVLTEMAEVDLLFFAYSHVPHFRQEYSTLLKEVATSLLTTLEQAAGKRQSV